MNSQTQVFWKFYLKKMFLREGFRMGEIICILNVYKTLVNDNSDIQKSDTKRILHIHVNVAE